MGGAVASLAARADAWSAAGSALAFYAFAAGLLASAAAVVANRNPVASAMALVVAMICAAALMIHAGAFFLGTIQILVYAGAVMVLFLFIIMLLDLKAEERRRFHALAIGAGAVVTAMLGAAIFRVVLGMRDRAAPAAAGFGDDVRPLGEALFTRYLLPFEATSFLLLVAMVGVVLLSRRAGAEGRP